MVEDGIYKIVKHIKIVDPDIVALQEVDTPDILKNITKRLGGSWAAHSGSAIYSDVGILTKHKILNNGQIETLRNVTASPFDQIRFNTNKTDVNRNSAISTSILLDSGLTVSFWTLHLDYRSYGPDAANNKLVTSKDTIIFGEDNQTPECRVGEVSEVLNHEIFQKSLNEADTNPVILCGDFNAPSHLDWIEENKELHGGWAIEWPTSKLLTEQANLTDSYRKIHPDPIKEPGNSWSTVQKFYGPEWGYTIPLQQDRVDYVFYRGARLEPTNSFLYAGTEEITPIPNQFQNDYPSDHYAIVTDFAIKPSGDGS
uniref:Endonuclease/exonuclease/phosphatase domain-containing protein n=1 Tax=Acrobeloides nanus TaxID=290746 RepID=A0A914E046_9BILA